MPDPKEDLERLGLPTPSAEDRLAAQLLTDLCRVDREEGIAKLRPLVTAARLWANGQVGKVHEDDTLRRRGEGQDEKFGY